MAQNYVKTVNANVINKYTYTVKNQLTKGGKHDFFLSSRN